MENFLRAVSENKIQTVRKMLPKINFTPDFNIAFKIAADQGLIKITKLLMEDPRFDPTFDDNYALVISVKKGYIEIVKLLLADDRIDPSFNDSVIFEVAVRSENIDMINFLLEDQRINPDYAIMSYFYSPQILEVLLQHPRIDPTIENNYPILWSCSDRNDDVEIFKVFLADPRVNPEDKNNIHGTCFGLAFENNRVKIIELLLADPQINPLNYDLTAEYYRGDDYLQMFDADYHHRSILRLIEEDKEKYPTYEIRQHNLPIDQQIQKLEIKIVKLTREYKILLKKYNSVKTAGLQDSIPELLLRVVVQDAEGMIDKLKRQIQTLQKSKI